MLEDAIVPVDEQPYHMGSNDKFSKGICTVIRYKNNYNVSNSA